MACKPISVALDVQPPSANTEIIFQLDKICNADGTAEWKLHFELKEKNASGAMVSVVKVDLDINKEDHAAAQATADNGMDANQRAQAKITGQTALGVKTGDATKADVEDQAGQIVPARDPNSPA